MDLRYNKHLNYYIHEVYNCINVLALKHFNLSERVKFVLLALDPSHILFMLYRLGLYIDTFGTRVRNPSESHDPTRT